MSLNSYAEDGGTLQLKASNIDEADKWVHNLNARKEFTWTAPQAIQSNARATTSENLYNDLEMSNPEVMHEVYENAFERTFDGRSGNNGPVEFRSMLAGLEETTSLLKHVVPGINKVKFPGCNDRYLAEKRRMLLLLHVKLVEKRIGKLFPQWDPSEQLERWARI